MRKTNLLIYTGIAVATLAVGWLARKHVQRSKQKAHAKGREEGYNQAAQEYEQKLQKQNKDFQKKCDAQKKERNISIKLMEDYENYLMELEQSELAVKEEAENLKAELEELREICKETAQPLLADNLHD